MNRYIYSKVYSTAKRIRNQALKEQDTDDTAGLCAYCSGLLRSALAWQGIETDMIEGEFRIDNPCPDYYTEEEGDCEFIYYPPHFWLEYGGYIIDITADQFNPELYEDELMPKIVIGKKEELWRYQKGKRPRILEVTKL